MTRERDPPNTHSISTSAQQSLLRLRGLLLILARGLTDAAEFLLTEITALHLYDLVIV